MKRLIAALAMLVCAESSPAAMSAPSASRRAGEVMADAAARNGVHARRDGAPADTPYDLRDTLSALDPAAVPVWAARADVDRAFSELREARFLFEDASPAFARRSSWLYPDDGCFARAALAADNLARWGFAPVAKVFSFGELRVDTANSPNGFVEWWYHVAPIVRLDDGALLVLDPAIQPEGPMALADWLGKQAADVTALRLTICAAAAYTPDDACRTVPAANVVAAMNDQRRFLRREWQRQVELGRDPAQVLGEAPLWGR